MVERYDAELLWSGDREDPTTPDYLMQVTPRIFLNALSLYFIVTLNRPCRSS
jgi:hypothetical protein